MTIRLDTADRTELIQRLKRYFDDELDRELGSFEAEFLLDFIGRDIATAFYNQGLRDAEAILQSKLMDISDELAELEQYPASRI